MTKLAAELMARRKCENEMTFSMNGVLEQSTSSPSESWPGWMFNLIQFFPKSLPKTNMDITYKVTQQRMTQPFVCAKGWVKYILSWVTFCSIMFDSIGVFPLRYFASSNVGISHIVMLLDWGCFWGKLLGAN